MKYVIFLDIPNEVPNEHAFETAILYTRHNNHTSKFFKTNSVHIFIQAVN